MAEMLSREELLADLEEFRELDSGRRRQLGGTPTERGYTDILKKWTK